jgi:hypothetical protein
MYVRCRTYCSILSDQNPLVPAFPEHATQSGDVLVEVIPLDHDCWPDSFHKRRFFKEIGDTQLDMAQRSSRLLTTPGAQAGIRLSTRGQSQ